MSTFTLKSPIIEKIVELRGNLPHDELFALRRDLWTKDVVTLKTMLPQS